MPTFQKKTIVEDFAEPEIFLEYKKVKIYCTYVKSWTRRVVDAYQGVYFNSWAEGMNQNYAPTKTSKRLFSTNRLCGLVPALDAYFDKHLEEWKKQEDQETRGVFNIQNIPNPNDHHITTHAGIKALLKEAIDWGYIKQDENPNCVHEGCHILAHPN